MAILAAISTSVIVGSSAFAQDTDDKKVEEVEVIEVTGIRANLTSSILAKRESKTIVDTISAEDIGKFPDANVAEALQRITGVSIDRSGGEGRFVSIRGLGPNFNTVLINGRQLATDTTDRSFSLDNLASGMIRSVDVYKSGTVQLTEGGIGGTVNISTASPLANPGFQFRAQAEGLYNSTNEEVEPQFSAIVSNTFADDKLGVLFSLNRTDRTQTLNNVVNWRTNAGDLALKKGTSWMPAPAGGWRKLEDVNSIQSLGVNSFNETRERTNATFVVEYEASDDLKITFDGLYSKFDVASEGYRGGGQWFWWPTGEYPDFPEGIDPVLDNETDRNVMYLQHGVNGQATAWLEYERPTDMASLGLNAEWLITDRLSLNADIFWSEANNNDKGNGRTQVIMEGGSDYIGVAAYDYRGGGNYPKYISDGNANDIPLGALKAAHYEAYGWNVDAENIGTKLDFSYDADMGPLVSVDFGFHHTTNTKQNQYWAVDNDAGFIYKRRQNLVIGQDSDGNNIQGVRVPADLTDYGSVCGCMPGIEDSQHVFKDIDTYMAWFSNPATLAQLNGEDGNLPGQNVDAATFFNNAGGLTPSKQPSGYQIEEELTALYVSGNFEFEVDDMLIDVTAGARYVETDLESSGQIIQLVDLIPDPVTEDNPSPRILRARYADDGSYVSVVESNSYSNFLPNLNVNIDVHEDVKLRFAASKTLTRPLLDSVAPWLTMNDGTRDCNGDGIQDGGADSCGTGSGSNPDLKPYLSTNFDVSLEWYYGEASMLSAAVFTKNVKDWIVTTTNAESVDLLTSEVNTYNVTRPTNIDDAEIEGFEVNVIHTFENGFGFQANYTDISSNAELTEESDFSLPGLSDNANLIAFYEKDGLSVRVAYNWRSEFLQNMNYGGRGEPQYTGAFEQVDFSVNYDVNENFTVYLNGLNVLDESTSKYGRHKNQFHEYSETGQRFSLGVRAKF